MKNKILKMTEKLLSIAGNNESFPVKIETEFDNATCEFTLSAMLANGNKVVIYDDFKSEIIQPDPEE